MGSGSRSRRRGLRRRQRARAIAKKSAPRCRASFQGRWTLAGGRSAAFAVATTVSNSCGSSRSRKAVRPYLMGCDARRTTLPARVHGPETNCSNSEARSSWRSRARCRRVDLVGASRLQTHSAQCSVCAARDVKVHLARGEPRCLRRSLEARLEARRPVVALSLVERTRFGDRVLAALSASGSRSSSSRRTCSSVPSNSRASSLLGDVAHALLVDDQRAEAAAHRGPTQTIEKPSRTQRP